MKMIKDLEKENIGTQNKYKTKVYTNLEDKKYLTGVYIIKD